MSRIVIFLLCGLCAFAQNPSTLDAGPPIPDSTPTPITSSTAKPTVVPTNATTVAPTTKPTTSPTTKPPSPTTKPTTTTPPTPTTKTTTTAPTPPPTPAPMPGPLAVNNFTGNYTGTNRICLMMKMAVQFELLDKNSTMINVTDKVTSNVSCASNTLETLSIFWGNNNLTFTFNKTDNKYEIQSIVANLSSGGNATMYYHQKSEFSVSTKQSYKCPKDQPLNLTDVTSNITLAKIHISRLQYQAFMNTTSEQYDSAWYCDATNTPDVVPIVVGCVLAVLVVLVLVAYLFGRRRCQARGYLSM